MGRDKALLPWPPQIDSSAASSTFLSSAIHSLAPFCDMVFVVAGNNAPNLEPTIYAAGAELARNPDPSRGQFSSLQTGLQQVLNRGRDAAIVTLVDRPPAKPATLHALLEEFRHACERGAWSVVPEFGARHGHPFIVGREMMTEFLRAPATSTAREIEHRHQSRIVYLPVEDPFVAMNVDTPEQYAALAGAPPAA